MSMSAAPESPLEPELARFLSGQPPERVAASRGAELASADGCCCGGEGRDTPCGCELLGFCLLLL